MKVVGGNEGRREWEMGRGDGGVREGILAWIPGKLEDWLNGEIIISSNGYQRMMRIEKDDANIVRAVNNHPL